MFFGPAAPESHDPGRERWVLVVRGEPRRVRKWLKAALRGYGIRCESVSSTTLVEQIAASRAECLMLREQVERLQTRLAVNRQKRCRRENASAAPIADGQEIAPTDASQSGFRGNG